ncbi:hypothetical protein [Pedobacter gandavensis]|uniref:hypothetical protein n=1 Tax=Pedobacter gandavensis TaxID=2679963 RepID=UPI002930D584|nr:hypothetical protein [Pedobacter gandavensis]
MLKKVLMHSLLFSFIFTSSKAQEKFDFKNAPQINRYFESLVKSLPKKTLDHPEFQLRLWFAVKPWTQGNDSEGLLLITYKNKQWRANKISFTNIKRIQEKNIITTSMKIKMLPLKSFDIADQFKALKADGLFNAKTITGDQIYELAIKRGFNTNKGFPTVEDGFVFTFELISDKAKRTFQSLYPKHFYDGTDKLIPELIPIIKIQDRLFNIAGITPGQF